ncbi:unnamed protein product [Rotaria sordida]|uniref:Clp ATPase C-terminal domain-containing protein n=1 Tax=Rotaria sordida TaxID=392033 RepID=A0A819GZ60_9BILA|nr:unnamed protein product [Rotaria sordida]CAF3887419.1 unnamed protein product [Rotaria sordida]
MKKNRKIDLTNTILVLSSNIRSKHILEEIKNLTSSEKPSNEKISPTIKNLVMKEMESAFSLEFLRGLDDIVLFQSFNDNQLFSIIHLKLKSLEARFKEQNIKISSADKAVQLILEKACRSDRGARPLTEYVDDFIISELSKLLMQNILPSNSHITIDINANDQYEFLCQPMTSSTSHTK